MEIGNRPQAGQMFHRLVSRPVFPNADAVVAAKLADRCEVCVSYSIGVADPVALSVETFETGIVSDERILDLIRSHFDFTPSNIRKELELDKVSFHDLAVYGHMGREDLPVRWEHVEDKAKELRNEYEKTKGTPQLL